MRRTAPLVATLGLLAACAGTGGPDLPALATAAISYDAQGHCYGTDISPAVIETVTVQEVDTPAVLDAEGRVVTPATYRSNIRQQIVREREEVRFETICPPRFTAEFVESLQRALKARGYYMGAVNGVLDTATGRAIQDFQRVDGPDSPLLSIAAARKLGLVALTREEIDRL